LAALQEVALAYLRRDVAETVPLWRMATTPVDHLRARAEALGVGEVVACASVTGGGTLPGVEIPSAGVAIEGDHAALLRDNEPPIIARVVAGRTVCDLRTVDPADDSTVAKALATCARPGAEPNATANANANADTDADADTDTDTDTEPA
jgi:L-seryl-tRNA(Ser) seleniumtransferase